MQVHLSKLEYYWKDFCNSIHNVEHIVFTDMF